MMDAIRQRFADTQAQPAIPTVDVDEDEFWTVMRNGRRRLVIKILAELPDPDGGIDLGDLAEVVAARESGKPRTLVDSSERKAVYVGMYQGHLDTLADAGLVDWSGRNVIRPTDETVPAARLLEMNQRAIGRDGERA